MKKLIVFNNKTNLDKESCVEYIRDIDDVVPSDKDVIICPSACLIPYFCGKYSFKLGGQNAVDDTSNSYTGDISFKQLKSFNAKYCLIGHSDRIINYNEDYKFLNNKIKSCIYYGLIPIVCIGETMQEKQLNKTAKVLYEQLRNYLEDIDVDADIVIAYEPIWTIGTGITASLKDIGEATTLIKDLVFKKYGMELRVIYGGSITHRNVKNIFNIKELDGVLIGSSSLKIKEISKILDEI